MFIKNKKSNNLLRFNNKLLYGNQKVYNIPSINEWENSLYKFNKSLYFETNVKDNLINKIFNSYFNANPKYLNINTNKKKFMSLKRIFISNLQIKHNINEVNITAYSFNKEKLYLLNLVNKWFSSLYINKYKEWYSNFILQNIKYKNKKLRFKSKLRFIKYKFIFNKFKYGQIFSYIVKGIISKNFLKNFKPLQFNMFILNTLYLYGLNSNINTSNIVYRLSLDIFNNKLRKIYIYKYYITMLYANNLKYSLNNMVGLINILNKIYKKKIIINIIKLKYLFLDNSLLTYAVIRKLNDRKKRILKVIRKALSLAKKAYLNHNLYEVILKEDNKYINTNVNKDILIMNKQNAIINNLNNKYLTGIKLQGNGRLTKRLTASRSILKHSNIGKLKNIVSSYQKGSAVILKGYTNSNVQYLNINSNNRNGSFGVKSWSSSY